MDFENTQKIIKEKLGREFTADERYILKFAWNKGTDEGKKRVIDNLVKVCEKESRVE